MGAVWVSESVADRAGCRGSATIVQSDAYAIVCRGGDDGAAEWLVMADRESLRGELSADSVESALTTASSLTDSRGFFTPAASAWMGAGHSVAAGVVDDEGGWQVAEAVNCFGGG